MCACVLAGLGRLSMRDGAYYEGEFVRGEMQGKGVRMFANGDQYVGELVSKQCASCHSNHTSLHTHTLLSKIHLQQSRSALLPANWEPSHAR